MEAITLKFNIGAPRVDYRGPWDIWIDELEKRTDGRVKIDRYHFNEMSPPDEIFNSVVNGTADVGLQWIMITPGEYPALEVMSLAKPGTICRNPSRVAFELYRNVTEIQAYFSDVKLLVCGATSPVPLGNSLLGTARKPVNTLEDLQGLKINASGTYAVKILKELGAVPMDHFLADMSDNIKNGILDGGLLDALWLDDMELRYVIKYLTQVNFGFIPYFMTMNQDAWNKLPSDIQNILEEISGDYFGDRHDEFVNKRGKEAVALSIEENGLKTIELSEGEIDQWENAFNVARDEFIEKMNAKGINGKELMALADSLYIKHA